MAPRSPRALRTLRSRCIDALVTRAVQLVPLRHRSVQAMETALISDRLANPVRPGCEF